MIKTKQIRGTKEITIDEVKSIVESLTSGSYYGSEEILRMDVEDKLNYQYGKNNWKYIN